MIVEAAARLHSFAHASFALQLASIQISSRHIQRIALQIGTELIQQRDHKLKLRRQRQLPVAVAVNPTVVAVEVDGGRLRTRAPESGPGVHDQQNKENKIACLVTLQSQVSEIDPQPQPPASLLLPRRVRRLVQQMHGKSADAPEKHEEQEDTATAAQPQKDDNAGCGPRKLVRTCVASMANSQAFGPMVAAEAQERGFYQAKRRAYLGDGAAYNWEIHRVYFSDFEAIVDFLHALCYVYMAAWGVGRDEKEKWSGYVVWMRACWQGRVKTVIDELTIWQREVGEPPGENEVDAKDPRVLVKEALTYLTNNQQRMDYPRYRKQGLPCTTSLAESLVGQFNARVKGSEKFWNRGQGCEAMLQLRAALLSEDDRLSRFFAQRPGNPYRRRNS